MRKALMLQISADTLLLEVVEVGHPGYFGIYKRTPWEVARAL